MWVGVLDIKYSCWSHSPWSAATTITFHLHHPWSWSTTTIMIHLHHHDPSPPSMVRIHHHHPPPPSRSTIMITFRHLQTHLNVSVCHMSRYQEAMNPIQWLSSTNALIKGSGRTTPNPLMPIVQRGNPCKHYNATLLITELLVNHKSKCYPAGVWDTLLGHSRSNFLAQGQLVSGAFRDGRLLPNTLPVTSAHLTPLIIALLAALNTCPGAMCYGECKCVRVFICGVFW